MEVISVKDLIAEIHKSDKYGITESNKWNFIEIVRKIPTITIEDKENKNEKL